MKKKLLALTLASSMMLSMTACGGPIEVDKDGDGKLDVVCTIYPLYDWVKEIGGEHVNAIYMLDSGIDLHNYVPTVSDIVTMKESDLFLYIGGDSDTWAENVVDKSFYSLKMIDTIGDKAQMQEVVEGMQEEDHSSEDDHDHDHDHHHDHDHDTYDEHIWLSLINAEIMVQSIVDKLSEIDEENKSFYQKQGKAYIEELTNLEATYAESLEEIENKTLVIADRFPFLYLAQDYGFDYYAAFTGCSSELEVSFETIAFLKEKVEELELDYVFKIEGASHQIAETVMEDNTQVLELNSMQSITGEDEKSYLSMMEENLEVLVKGLGENE